MYQGRKVVVTTVPVAVERLTIRYCVETSPPAPSIFPTSDKARVLRRGA